MRSEEAEIAEAFVHCGIKDALMKYRRAQDRFAYRDFCLSVARLEAEIRDQNGNRARARFIHPSLGHEAAAFFVTRSLSPDRALWALYYRSHAWLLALGVLAADISAHINGAGEGLSSQSAGPMHLFLHPNIIDCNSIVGAQIPIAVGAALANRREGLPVVCVLGDGATNTGVFYEAVNIASVYKVPILFVVENNDVAMETPYERTAVSSIRAKFELFSVPFFSANGQDLESVAAVTADACAISIHRPAALCIAVKRVGPHALSSLAQWPQSGTPHTDSKA